ncbi:MAG: histidine triad nucleotide-binding protein [Lachnospiraceae bacterium]|nr:histidine triad nucleotide-binding protein [Ruminococcus sp.]MCM1274250.1 histidine triad nucleotide-binding protein [Lachnospiraceae bacterium]
MMDCLFCKIIAGEIPSTKVYEDDKILAFRDINPQAPVHILVIPKEHIGGVDELTPENSAAVAHIFAKIAEIAKNEGLTDGYRVVSNVGEHGCQSVRHLHFHILGGRQLDGSMV